MPESFKPIANMESEILILGTLPGVVSLQKQRYYAHPRNQFWPIIYDVFDSEIQVEYEDKCCFLLKNKIALWDIVGKAKRDICIDFNYIKVLLSPTVKDKQNEDGGPCLQKLKNNIANPLHPMDMLDLLY